MSQVVESIGLAQVLEGATPFSVGNINDTFRGLIRLPDGSDKAAILKDLNPKELANEVLAAAVGIAIGMPIPPPYIALATFDRLATSKGPEIEGGRLVFASVDVKTPPVVMLYNGGLGPAVLQRLAQWPHVGKLYGFDALVANIDRHAGNLLFSGRDEVWLIDHGWCFTGPDWSSSDLSQPDAPVENRLREWLTPVLDLSRRSLAAGGASSVSESLRDTDFALLASANHVSGLLDDGDFAAVVDYLSGRCKHTTRLAAEALEMLGL